MTMSTNQTLQLPGFRHHAEMSAGELSLLQDSGSTRISFGKIKPTPWTPATTGKGKPYMVRTCQGNEAHQQSTVSCSIEVLAMIDTQQDTGFSYMLRYGSTQRCFIGEYFYEVNWRV